MTEQEKQDLIAECRRTINAGTPLQSTYREVALAKIARIALESLTAPPVKLPSAFYPHPAIPNGVVMRMDSVNGSWLNKNLVVSTLKEHGIEVEE